MNPKKLIKSVHLAPFMLMPCKKDVCQECAVDHKTTEPHNQQSLFWQYRFYGEHGRWPTWHDAMAHCSQETKDIWIRELQKRGVNLPQESGQDPNT
jgi:hypothetical protein